MLKAIIFDCDGVIVDSEPFHLKALHPPLLTPSECVVIEDSLRGTDAARAAGMKCLAVTNSYSRDALNGRADRIVASLAEVEPKDLDVL